MGAGSALFTSQQEECEIPRTAKRHIMRIELSGSAKKKHETLSDHHGMTQVAMMSRLVEWMTQQDQSIRWADHDECRPRGLFNSFEVSTPTNDDSTQPRVRLGMVVMTSSSR